MMDNRKHLKASLISGLGFVIGVVLIKLIFDSGLLDSVNELFAAQHLMIGITILFLMVILGGALAGAIGGFSLTYAIPVENRNRTISRSAIGIGIGFGFGVVLLPITGLLAMLAMYNAGDASHLGFVISMGVVGAIFGFVSGVMTATLPSRSNYWRVTGILTIAFGVGGLAFGFGLWNYFYVLFETGAGTADLLFSFFVFGAVGGMVMGWLFNRDIEKVVLAGDEDKLTEQGNIFYRTGQWLESTKFYQKRGFWGTVFFFAFIFILTRLLALSPLIFSEAYLADELPLDAIGVHWSSPWIVAETSTGVKQPSISQLDDLLVIAWVQENGVYYATSTQVDGVVRIWEQPVRLSNSAGTESADPQVAVDPTGRLHFVWTETPAGKGSGSVIQYRACLEGECTETALNTQGLLALEVALSGEYRPTDDLVPYCYNQFDHLVVLPKAEPGYSDNPTTLNGAFDDVSALIQTARYEVLLSTMWYETGDTGTSPGHVLGKGVKDLYDKVKAHPEQYPRGMTVRILLDNPPEFTLSRLISQIWSAFNHMLYAGLPTMSDPEIDWKLEIANFDGSWLHGHTKMVVVDGKSAVAAGFNYQHKHQSRDHPSGKGKDDYDLGLQMTGPVAQTTRLAFDDLWSGSNNIVCPDLDSDSPLWWITCRRETAVADHVPEVKKLYLATENYNAFALHRTTKFQESDETVPTTIASAQETLDVLQVNFTLPLICDLNLIFEICDFRDVLSYMQAMMDAIKTNHVKTRVLIKPGPIEAVESNIAVKAFRKELAAKGLSHLVEFRYFQDSVHAKSVLIDNQFLLVGSQNFHYSAYGDGALTEFNIGTDNPNAVAAFQKFFEYHWERGEPIPEK